MAQQGRQGSVHLRRRSGRPPPSRRRSGAPPHPPPRELLVAVPRRSRRPRPRVQWWLGAVGYAQGRVCATRVPGGPHWPGRRSLSRHSSPVPVDRCHRPVGGKPRRSSSSDGRSAGSDTLVSVAPRAFHQPETDQTRRPHTRSRLVKRPLSRTSRSDLTVRTPLQSTARAAHVSGLLLTHELRPRWLGHQHGILARHWSKPRSPPLTRRALALCDGGWRP